MLDFYDNSANRKSEHSFPLNEKVFPRAVSLPLAEFIVMQQFSWKNAIHLVFKIQRVHEWIVD